MIAPGRGYAVISREHGIHIETVQRTEVGAMVNGLLIFGHLVAGGTSDEEVRALWDQALATTEPGRVWVAPVQIAMAQDG